MSNYKRKEVMDYLTRKPVTQQDFQAALDVSSLRPTAPMPATSGEDLGTREGFKLGSSFENNLLKKQIPNVRVRKQPDGKLYIAGRYTNKDGQRVTAGVKTFDPATATQKEVDEFLKTLNKKLSGKIIGRDEALQQVFKTKLNYSELKKQYTTEVMDWLDEGSKNPKYKTSEQLQKDLFKEFNKPKYTEAPKGVDPKSIFFKDNKFSIPRETEIFGRKLGPQKVPEKTINDLSDFFLLKNNPNFEKVRDAAYGFFTQKKADINKLPAEQQKILRNFSKDFIKGQIKGEAGESIFLSGLKQEGFNFENKVNEALYIKSLEEKIAEELSNPNISNNRKNFLNKQLGAIENQRTNIIKNLNQTHPNLFRSAKNPGNLVYEHKVPRFIKDMINLPYDYLARASFAPNAFNMYKLDQFDGPLGKLITEYNSTNDVTAKNEIKNKIEKLKDDFNNKTKVKGQGYLDEVEFKFGNKVKLIDNTPLISDLTNKNVYENILRNVNHSNKFFEKEGLQKYIVKGDDFKNYTRDLQNRISINKGAYYSFPAQVSESTFLGTLAGKSKDAVSNAYSAFKFTGGPINALIGAIINSPEMEKKGLSPAKALTYGAIKGSTEDVLNFGAQILAAGPLMQKTLFEASTEYKKQPPAGIDSFDQVGGKQGLQSKFFNELFSVNPFDISNIPIIGSTWAAEKQTTKETIDNFVNLETRKRIAELYPAPDISETTVPGDNNIMQQQEEQIKKDLYKNIFQDPRIKKEYEQAIAITPEPKKESPSSTGPFYFGTEPSQEFYKGGRAKFAEGSDDPESDLYIPPLNKESISGTNVPKEGIDGLYFGTRQEQRPIPVDPMTGKPILSGGMRELKQVFSSLLSDTRPEAGYRKGNIDFYASKGINPFQGDTDFKYGASYTPEGNVGKFMIDKTPQYLGAGYNYQKDGLDFGITGLKNQMGDKSIALRFGYNYATGGRVGFSGGGGANFLKMLRNISDSLLGIKNSTHILGNTARFNGITKAAEEALTPYINIPNQNKHTTVLESIKKAKENLPKEYHGILDEMKSYADKHAYDAVDDMAKALDKIVDPNLKFESLPQNMFPMEDPLNSAFIIMDPQRNNMRGRFVNRVRVDPETGRGTRETFDTFDSKTRTFLKEEDWKPVGVESLEKGKEGLN
jgi:hypothetical protein